MMGAVGLPSTTICAVLLACVAISVVSAEFCIKGTASAPFQLSESIGSSFTVDMYAVDPIKQKAYRVKEHYSEAAKKAAAYITYRNGYRTEEKFFIRDLKKGKTLTDWNGNKCKKSTGKEPRFGLMAFRDSKDISITYVGTEKVTGQTLHLWRGCHKTSSGEEIREDIYTSGKNDEWGTPSGKDYEPVKMIRKVKSGTLITQFNYYIIKFANLDSDDNGLQADLEPPLGTVCPGKTEVSLPTLPESVIYSIEDYDTVDTYIVDTDKKLVIEETTSRYSKIPKLNIDNYNMGVLVTLDDQTGCDYTSYAVLEDPKLNKTLSYIDSVSSSGFKTVGQFIGMEGNGFTYSGQHQSRGIPCDVYTKQYTDYKGYGDTTVVLYFTSQEVTVQDNKLERVLVKKSVSKTSSYSTKKPVDSTIFDFRSLDYSRLDYDPQDITKCEDDVGGVNFGMILKGNGATKLSGTKTQKLKTDLRSALAKAAGVDEMRMHIGVVAPTSGALSIEGKLIGPPPIFDNIKEEFGSVQGVPDSKIITSFWEYSKDSCKDRALEDTNVKLISYCGNNCTTYSTNENAQVSSWSYTCTTFWVGNNAKAPVDLDTAWNTLAVDVDAGKIMVQGYKASDVVKEGAYKSDLDGDLKYDLYEKSRLNSYDAVTTNQNMAFSDCSDQCTNQLTYECEAFTYCAKTKLCKLNKNEGNHNYVDSMEQDDNCDVYVRKYTSEFTPIAGTSALAGTDLMFEKIDDPNTCAHICLTNGQFRCESFDFCQLDEAGGSGTCSLGREHVYSIVKNSHTALLVDTKCTHYSRSYIGDYNEQAGVTTLPVLNQIKEAGAEGCAHACSQEDTEGEVQCTMFQVCDGVCELLDETSLQSGNGHRKDPSIKAKEGCQTHVLKDAMYLVHGRAVAARKAKTASITGDDQQGSSSGPYGPGSMAALALVMLPLAFGAVFLALFAWAHYQRGGGLDGLKRRFQGPSSFDNPSMKFSKDDMDI